MKVRLKWRVIRIYVIAIFSILCAVDVILLSVLTANKVADVFTLNSLLIANLAIIAITLKKANGALNLLNHIERKVYETE